MTNRSALIFATIGLVAVLTGCDSASNTPVTAEDEAMRSGRRDAAVTPIAPPGPPVGGTGLQADTDDTGGGD